MTRAERIEAAARAVVDYAFYEDEPERLESTTEILFGLKDRLTALRAALAPESGGPTKCGMHDLNGDGGCTLPLGHGGLCRHRPSSPTAAQGEGCRVCGHAAGCHLDGKGECMEKWGAPGECQCPAYIVPSRAGGGT